MLFARRDEEVLVFGLLGCGGILLVGLFLLSIFYLVSLMKAIQACSPRNQSMAPGLVWLNLVPVVNWFWPFWTVIQVGNSLQREYESRGMRGGGGFGKVTGVLAHLLGVFAPCLNAGGFAAALAAADEDVSPLIFFTSNGVGNLFAIVHLILLIVYWVQIAGYTRSLASSRADDFDDRPRRGRGEDEEDDRRDEFDDDYRPRPRRGE